MSDELSDRPYIFCPIMKGPCLSSRCAWFMDEWNVCAVVSIAVDIDLINSRIVNFDVEQTNS